MSQIDEKVENTDVESKDDEKTAAKHIEISGLVYDPKMQTVSFNAKMTGNIQQGTSKSGIKWQIKDATTEVKAVKVPLRDFLVKVLVGWFWVRKVQDILRKGTVQEARSALNGGYDWSTATARKAGEKAAPAVVGERAIGLIDSKEDLQRMIQLAQAKMLELEAKGN